MNNWKKLSIILLWLGIWQITATFIHNPIMLVGPIEALQTLWGVLPSGDFWISIYQSFLRISIGFLTAFMIGLLLGSLALIWAGSRNLSIFIAFIVVLPVIYVNTISGLESTDQKLLEMAAIFRLPLWKRVRFIYLPALVPYLLSACRTALGMSCLRSIWKQLISLPGHW